jgi:hypothetical protein
MSGRRWGKHFLESSKGNDMHNIPHTEAAKRKMSETKKGKHYSLSTEFKKGRISPHKGKRRPGIGGNPNWVLGHKPWNTGIPRSSETKEKISKVLAGRHLSPTTEIQAGEKSPFWKGDAVGRGQVHRWVKSQIGKGNRCDLCGGENRKLDLSNKDHKYRRRVEDYWWLCRPCHKRYDDANLRIRKNEAANV